MKNCIVAIVGDLHVNSTVALCPPSFQLDDGGTNVSAKVQRWVWNKWLDYWNTAKELKDNYGYPILTVINGELADDLKYVKTQLITTNQADMIKMAYEVLEPAIEISNGFIVLRGTEAHTGPGGYIDELIARDIGAIQDDKGNYSRYEWQEDWAGVKFHVAHHPGMASRRPWTSAAVRLAAKMVADYISDGLWPPHLAIFGHNHVPDDSYKKVEPTRAIIHPSWQLTNAFGYKINGSPIPIGGLFVLCHGDGDYDIVEKYYRWPRPRWTTTKKSHLHMTS